MSFAERCVHCDHFKGSKGECCFCHALVSDLKKTAAQHMAELGYFDDIDV